MIILLVFKSMLIVIFWLNTKHNKYNRNALYKACGMEGIIIIINDFIRL